MPTEKSDRGSAPKTERKHPNRSRIERPVSAGGVVYRVVNSKVETILCGRFVRSKPSSVNAQLSDSPRVTEEHPDCEGEMIRWSLAKGTPDPGETLEQTALREVREETGLDVELQEPIRTIDYWFSDRSDDVRYHKTVHFYLMVPVGGDTSLHDPEFDVVQWFPAEKALETLNYANEADVLRQALERIHIRQEGG